MFVRHIVGLDAVLAEGLVNGGVVGCDLGFILALIEMGGVGDAMTFESVSDRQVVVELKVCQHFGINRLDDVGYRLGPGQRREICVTGLDDFGSNVFAGQARRAPERLIYPQRR